MCCPRCGEWSVYLQYGRRTCLVCGWTEYVEWANIKLEEDSHA